MMMMGHKQDLLVSPFVVYSPLLGGPGLRSTSPPISSSRAVMNSKRRRNITSDPCIFPFSFTFLADPSFSCRSLPNRSKTSDLNARK